MHTSTKPITVTVAELARHHKRDDCWVAVHSGVWDLTDFIDQHPGGPDVILQVAGSDGTEEFDQIHAPGLLEENIADKYRGQLLGDTVCPPASNQDESHQEELPHSIEAEEVQPIQPAQVASSKPVVDTEMASEAAEAIKGEAKEGIPPLHTLISAQDFADVASRALTAKTWAFYSSAATDLITHRQNKSLLRSIMVQPRVLRDVRDVDLRRTILGCDSQAPFFISPAAMARMAHPDGELAMSRAAGAQGLVQCISSNASYTLSQIVQAGKPAQPYFFQLYVNSQRSKTEELLRKARQVGVRALFVTVDAPVPGKREADERLAAGQARAAISGATATDDKKGGGLGRLMGQYIDKSLTWADLPWLREVSGLPIVLKGVQTVEDAQLAVEHGVDAIFLSNHGGRSLDTSQPAILNLLELRLRCPDIFSKLEVYVDGGFDRGLDILKAIALGATAVGIGRPFMYSLVYGQEGTEHLTQILKDEIEVSMRLLGVTSLDQLTPDMLNVSVLEPLLKTPRLFQPIAPRAREQKL